MLTSSSPSRTECKARGPMGKANQLNVADGGWSTR